MRHSALFTACIVLLLVSMWATISALAPYSAEVYPTGIQAAGAGVVAGAALLGALPAGIAALMLVFIRIETRGRRLEEISALTLDGSFAEPGTRCAPGGGIRRRAHGTCTA